MCGITQNIKAVITNAFEKRAAAKQQSDTTQSNRITKNVIPAVAGSAGVLSVDVGSTVANATYMRYNDLLNSRSTPLGERAVQKQNRAFNSVAKKMGYKQGADGMYYHPTRKGRPLWFTGSISDLGAAYADKDIYNETRAAGSPRIDRDQVSMYRSTRYRDKGMMAHELGHSLQSKSFMRRMFQGEKLRKGSILGIIGANIVNPEFDTTPIAALGTVGGLTNLAGEMHASYLGSKAFRSKRGKLSAFRGVPTYAMIAATPYLAHKASQWTKEKMKEYNK